MEVGSTFNLSDIEKVRQAIKRTIKAEDKDGIKRDKLVENWLQIKRSLGLSWSMYEVISAFVLCEMDIKLTRELGFTGTCTEDVLKMHRPDVSVNIFHVSEVYLDDKKVDNHCGVVIISLMDRLVHHPFHYTSVPLFLIPRLRFKSMNRFTSNPLPHRQEDISKVFCCPSENVAGFIFNPRCDDQGNKLPRTLIMKMNVELKGTDTEEVEEFRKSIGDPFKFNHSMALLTERACLASFLTTMVPQNKRFVLKLFGPKSESSNAKPDVDCGSLRREFYRSYVYFLSKNPVTKLQCKQMIRFIEDFPRFLVSKLGWENTDFMLHHLVRSFITDHKCGANNCGNFSYLKCSGCKEVVYCSVECQDEDYDEHLLFCDELSSNHSLKQLVPKELQNLLLQIHKYKGEVVSFATFLRELQIKALETFFDSFSKVDRIVEHFMVPQMNANGYTKKPFDEEKLLQLVRRRRNFVPYDTLCTQMLRMYGVKPFIDVFEVEKID